MVDCRLRLIEAISAETRILNPRAERDAVTLYPTLSQLLADTSHQLSRCYFTPKRQRLTISKNHLRKMDPTASGRCSLEFRFAYAQPREPGWGFIHNLLKPPFHTRHTQASLISALELVSLFPIGMPHVTHLSTARRATQIVSHRWLCYLKHSRSVSHAE